MCITLHQWERGFEPGAKDSLTWLRRLRDAVAEDLLQELHYLVGNLDEDIDGRDHTAREIMERLLTYENANWAAQYLNKIFSQHNAFAAQNYNIEKLEVLRQIVVRIASLERERCGDAYFRFAKTHCFAT